MGYMYSDMAFRAKTECKEELLTALLKATTYEEDGDYEELIENLLDNDSDCSDDEETDGGEWTININIDDAGYDIDTMSIFFRNFGLSILALDPESVVEGNCSWESSVDGSVDVEEMRIKAGKLFEYYFNTAEDGELDEEEFDEAELDEENALQVYSFEKADFHVNWNGIGTYGVICVAKRGNGLERVAAAAGKGIITREQLEGALEEANKNDDVEVSEIILQWMS